MLLGLALVVSAHAPGAITVRPGDTLWELAKEHGTTVAALKALNGLSGDNIRDGQVLQLGGSSGGSSTGAAAAGTHVVSAGETLSQLAVRYGTTSSAVRSANGMSSSTIVIGRRLSIPGAGAGAAPATAPAPAGPAAGTSPSVAPNRATLASRSHPDKGTVRSMVAATARRHGVSPSLAVAIAYQESGFQQRVVSGVNAIGVMQVLPTTGRNLGRQHGLSFDLLDTQDNITAGVLLLRQLQRSVGSNDMILAGYYQGLGSIAQKGLLPQTHQYIKNINYLRSTRFPSG
ncbi:hypothetical protein BH24ACT10_BH24ACT10_07680 [soil metagenome]